MRGSERIELAALLPTERGEEHLLKVKSIELFAASDACNPRCEPALQVFAQLGIVDCRPCALHVKTFHEVQACLQIARFRSPGKGRDTQLAQARDHGCFEFVCRRLFDTTLFENECAEFPFRTCDYGAGSSVPLVSFTRIEMLGKIALQ